MQASLYQFLPDPRPVLRRLRAAARERVIVAEPIRNLADSEIRMLAFLARKFTNPGTGEQPNRFDESRLDALLRPYHERGQVLESRLISGEREKLYILVPITERRANR